MGPGVTFALREALYGLDHIADILDPQPLATALRDAMERLMQREPGHWRRYYEGEGVALFAQRHFSYSDRIRYYWPHAEARAAVAALMARFDGRAIPETLISQYLPRLADDVRDGAVRPLPRDLLIAGCRTALDPYSAACADRVKHPCDRAWARTPIHERAETQDGPRGAAALGRNRHAAAR